VEFHALTTDDVRERTKAVVEGCGAVEHAQSMPLLLRPVVCSSYCVQDTMSVLRAFNLFRAMGCRNMVVTDLHNRVVGMLERDDFADVVGHHDAGHGHGHGGHGHGGHGNGEADAQHQPAPPATTGAANREALLPRPR
jgi:hypothetical protein